MNAFRSRRAVPMMVLGAGFIACTLALAVQQPTAKPDAAKDGKPADTAAPGDSPAEPPKRGYGPATTLSPQGIGRLMQALQTSPGCLGVDSAQMASGKNTIFAWFDSKQSALAWYNNPAHQAMATAANPGRDRARVPMADVPDEVGPMMIVACATPIPKDQLRPGEVEGSLRLGIELYSPLPGGVRFNNGSFAPASFGEAVLKEAGPRKRTANPGDVKPSAAPPSITK